MQRPHIPGPISMQVPPKHRTPRRRKHRKRTTITIHQPTPLPILPRPGHLNLRKIRPAILTICVKDPEEGRLAVMRLYLFEGAVPVVVSFYLLGAHV